MGATCAGGEVLDISDAVVFEGGRCPAGGDEGYGQVMGGVPGGENLQLLAEESTMVTRILGGGRHGRWSVGGSYINRWHDHLVHVHGSCWCGVGGGCTIVTIQWTDLSFRKILKNF